MKKNKKIVVVGLGYVGLPLAMSFARYFKVIGFDVDKDRINELKRGYDRKLAITKKEFKDVKDNISFTNKEKEIAKGDIVIICVPTPIKKDTTPDLSYLKSASEIVGRNLKKGQIVVYESTVYPGCTEEFCLPILEKESRLKLGDFAIGYSPERINPGDEKHTIDKITKIVSGYNKKTTKELTSVYDKITNVYPVNSIKVAESAKVIENVQRDLNIALFNELAMLFQKMEINPRDVFEAASTKWNFIKLTPGLVGGHCLPVDPYYLAHKAQEVGFDTKIILAGRSVNEFYPQFLAQEVLKKLVKINFNFQRDRMLILGATYKKDVPDLRESKIEKFIDALKEYKIRKITIWEPLVLDKKIFGLPNQKPKGKFKAIILAVHHRKFKGINVKKYLSKNGIFIDLED